MEWFFLECTKVKAHNLYSIYRSSMSKAAANVEADVPTVALHVLNKTVNHKRKSSCAVSFVLKLWTERWLALQHNSTAPCTMQQTLRFKLPGKAATAVTRFKHMRLFCTRHVKWPSTASDSRAAEECHPSASLSSQLNL